PGATGGPKIARPPRPSWESARRCCRRRRAHRRSPARATRAAASAADRAARRARSPRSPPRAASRPRPAGRRARVERRRPGARRQEKVIVDGERAIAEARCRLAPSGPRSPSPSPRRRPLPSARPSSTWSRPPPAPASRSAPPPSCGRRSPPSASTARSPRSSRSPSRSWAAACGPPSTSAPAPAASSTARATTPNTIAALAWFPIYRLARAVVTVVPRPRALVLLGLLVALAALLVVAAVLSVDWRIIDFGPAEALALFFVLMALFAIVFARRRLPPTAVMGAAWAFAAICLLATWLSFGNNARAVAFAGEESMGEKVLLKVARRFADHDHDGYAARLGGGDCNDRDPKVHPGADE